MNICGIHLYLFIFIKLDDRHQKEVETAWDFHDDDDGGSLNSLDSY
jgi:hypothetical protein